MPKINQRDADIYYRLYVKENATLSNLRNRKLWNTATEGELQLNASCIHKLISNHFKAGNSFPTFKKDTNHGRALENQFKNLPKASSVNLLHDFATMFKIEKQEEFEKNQTLFDTYKNMYEEELYANDEFDTCYIFYFWQEEQVQKARLVCTWNKEKIEKGRFTLSEFNKAKGEWELYAIDDNNQEICQSHQGTNLYLSFISNAPITIILHSHDTRFKDKPFILCTYTIIFKGLPISGTGLLQKTDSKKIKTYFNNPVEPEIFNLLFHRTNFLHGKEQNYISNKSDTHFRYQTDFSEEAHGDHLTGVYEGFFLDKFFQNTTALRIQLMEIDVSGLVRFLNEGEITKGFCSLAGNEKLLYITSDYKFDIGGMPRINIIAEVPNKEFEQMEGICSGYTVTNRPYLGQILFRKIKGISTIETALKNKYKSLEITHAKQNKPENEKFFTAELLNFFFGERFYSSPHACFQADLFNKYKINDKKYNGPNGFFYLYSTSTYQWHIISYPVLIESSGEVRMKDKNQNLHKGSARIFMQDYLILNFNDFENDTEPSKGQFIFCIHDNQIKRFAGGISSRINNKKNPQAKREFLIRYPFDSYKNPEKLINYPEVFKASQNKLFQKNSPEYLEIKKYYKHIDTLLGREYNLMVISDATTKEEKVFAREPFEEIYLNEAIFSFLKGLRRYKKPGLFSIDVKSIIRHYFTLAIQHGFFEVRRVVLYIEEYCRNINRDAKEVKEYFQILHYEIIKDAQSHATK